jgi:hypothetical protein
VLLLGTTQEYVLIPVTGPAGVDLTQYVARVALRPDDGSEPVAGDWKAATWMGGQAAMLYHPGDYAPGEYMAYVTLAAGVEAPVIRSGRVRVGDVRT